MAMNQSKGVTTQLRDDLVPSQQNMSMHDSIGFAQISNKYENELNARSGAREGESSSQALNNIIGEN